jgi:hypothetical protein
MNVHIYKNGKYLRTERDVKEGSFVDVEGDPSEYELVKEQILPPTRWPEGAEL